MRKVGDQLLLRALAAELKGRRLALGVSQEDLAHRAGLARTFIGKMELAETQPSLAVLFQLAEALEIDVVDFVAGVSQRVIKERRGAKSRAQSAA